MPPTTLTKLSRSLIGWSTTLRICAPTILRSWFNRSHWLKFQSSEICSLASFIKQLLSCSPFFRLSSSEWLSRMSANSKRMECLRRGLYRRTITAWQKNWTRKLKPNWPRKRRTRGLGLETPIWTSESQTWRIFWGTWIRTNGSTHSTLATLCKSHPSPCKTSSQRTRFASN